MRKPNVGHACATSHFVKISLQVDVMDKRYFPPPCSKIASFCRHPTARMRWRVTASFSARCRHALGPSLSRSIFGVDGRSDMGVA
jgi:hypothetical protein